jgi:hypothetical protein
MVVIYDCDAISVMMMVILFVIERVLFVPFGSKRSMDQRDRWIKEIDELKRSMDQRDRMRMCHLHRRQYHGIISKSCTGSRIRHRRSSGKHHHYSRIIHHMDNSARPRRYDPSIQLA